MALEVNAPHASPTPPTQKYLPAFLTKSKIKRFACHICCPLKSIDVNFPKKKMIHTLVAVLTCMSIFRLLRLAITTYSSSPDYDVRPDMKSCNSLSSTCENIFPHNDASIVTIKEFQFLSKLISRRSPCNLLIFGPERQYLPLSKLNAAGTTIILDDGAQKSKDVRSNSTMIYKVEYKTPAKKAYELLKHARTERVCAPDSGPLEASSCKLALTTLPREVYKIKWDVIVVDDPISDGPDAPGRMGAIYTAGFLARGGNVTDVVVHDVNRMIERWFSWEFLCQENLFSSKGKFWNFRIVGSDQHKPKSFCGSDCQLLVEQLPRSGR